MFRGGVSGYIRQNLLIIVAICAQLPLGAALNHCSHPPFAQCCFHAACMWRVLFPGVGYGVVLAVCATSFAYAFTYVIKLLVCSAILHCLCFPPVCSFLFVPTCHIGHYIQLVSSCPYACSHLVLICLCLLLLGNYFLPVALALSV